MGGRIQHTQGYKGDVHAREEERMLQGRFDKIVREAKEVTEWMKKIAEVHPGLERSETMEITGNIAVEVVGIGEGVVELVMQLKQGREVVLHLGGRIVGVGETLTLNGVEVNVPVVQVAPERGVSVE